MATLTAAADGRSATMAAAAGADTNDSATTRRDFVPGAGGGTVEEAMDEMRPGGETVAAGSGPGAGTSAAPTTGSAASGTPAASGDRADVRGGDSAVRTGEGARDSATLPSGTGGDRHAGSGSVVRGEDTDTAGGTASVAGDSFHGRGVVSAGSAGASGGTASMTDPATTGPATTGPVPGGSVTGGTDTAASAGGIAGPASSPGPAGGSTTAAATSGANGGTGAQAPSGAGDTAARDDVTAAISADAFGPSARSPGFIAGGTGAGAERQTASDTSGMELPALARDAAMAFDPASGPVGAGVWPNQPSDASGLWHEFRSEWLHSGGGGSGALTDLPDRRNDAGLTPDASVLPS